MKNKKLTRKEVKERNQKMYEMYMTNENLGNRDIARIFDLSLQSADVILNKIKKENNVTRVIKPRANKMGVTEEEILNTFKELKTLNKTSNKLKISPGYIAKIVRRNDLEKLISETKPKLSKSQIKERNQNIWKFFIEEKPKNYGVIEKKFNLSRERIKIIMRNLKKENNYPLGIIPTKPKRISSRKNIIRNVKPVKFINSYEQVTHEKGIDIKNLFAY